MAKEGKMLDYKLEPSELKKLRQYHKICRVKSTADRIKAVYLLGSGWSMASICEALLLSDDTVRRYFETYKEKGLYALVENKLTGKACFLTEEEKKLLSTHLSEHTYAKVSEIIEFVEEEYDVSYSDSGMRKVLIELDFVYKKPEKVPYQVDEASQRRFIKRYKRIKKVLKKGDSIYFMDATHPEHTAIPAYGWIKKGETKVIKSNPRPYRLNINGAINIQSLETVVCIEKELNKETVKDFLEKLRKKQPRGMIYLICDNAGYYTSPEVKLLAKAMAIKLIHLPPYSPNLNPIERLWKYFKKQVLYNKYYETFSEMQEASSLFFKRIKAHEKALRTLITDNFQIIAI